MGSGLFRVKNIDQLISDADEPERRLKKSLGWLSLTALGIGAMIGSGIFTVIGTAIAGQKLEVSSILKLRCLISDLPFRRHPAVPAPARRSRFRSFWWPSSADLRRCVTPNWPP